jgi:hypothetical protein
MLLDEEGRHGLPRVVMPAFLFRTFPAGTQPMDPPANLSTLDRPCPLPFVVVPAFVGGLIWVYALLTHIAH